MAKAAGDPDIEGGIETSLMIGFRNEHRPEEAIFFGLEAVNSYQQIRKNISGLDKDLQAGFAQSKSSTYRMLAELLVETGRLGEAEQVLDLLKEQELKDIVRGAAPDAGGQSRAAEADRRATEGAKRVGRLRRRRPLALEELSMEYAASAGQSVAHRRGRRSTEDN